MKHHLDMRDKKMIVTRPPEAKLDNNGDHRKDKHTGEPLWATQVLVMDEDGGTVISISTRSPKSPDVDIEDVVETVGMEAIPWATNGRSGIAYRADDIFLVVE